MIHNREAFLERIARKLGRPRISESVKRPSHWEYGPQWRTLADVTQEELLLVFERQCRMIHTDVRRTESPSLPDVLLETIRSYNGNSVICSDDPRFDEFGLSSLCTTQDNPYGLDVYIWDPEKGKTNIERAEQADVGISISDITLAESGTVVLMSGGGKGRSVSLLPRYFIAIVPLSTLVPRMTQAARMIRDRAKRGEAIPSCVNFISGPSNSADIEMNLVVGVHGPVKATYIVVTDR
ncbi:LutC/YkgG family protein [Polycladomyces subterraneus]|uniref:Lactate utilization protein C n=1 Tax=Polycladomyces subterraneus TaxID=1016997 RepID=A0ABT8ILM9_9BACL|nr:lactate utilization protein C [Polycladomyces subterraneus]MDN4593685.1 lactate utilization protein C [Polycladomyces subterraneus]